MHIKISDHDTQWAKQMFYFDYKWIKLCHVKKAIISTFLKIEIGKNSKNLIWK
jgi:hypothetical protein